MEISSTVLSPTSPPHLLIVDDEPMMQELFRLLIPADQYAITFCGGGQEALAAVRCLRFDLVLTDNRMPDFSGIDLAHALFHESPETPVVLMSGHEVTTGQQLPSVMGFLRKPFSQEELLRTLSRALIVKRGAAAPNAREGQGRH